MDKNSYRDFIFPIAVAKTLVPSQLCSEADIKALGGKPFYSRQDRTLECYNRGVVVVTFYAVGDDMFSLHKIAYPEDILRKAAQQAHNNIQRITDSQKKNPFF